MMRSRNGFTLIEMLAVVSLVALLALFLLRGIGEARAHWIDKVRLEEARRILEYHRLAEMSGVGGTVSSVNDIRDWLPPDSSLLGGLNNSAVGDNSINNIYTLNVTGAGGSDPRLGSVRFTPERLEAAYGANYNSATGQIQLFNRMTNIRPSLYTLSAHAEKKLYFGEP